MTACQNKWHPLSRDFFSSSIPKRDNQKNGNNKPLTEVQLYGKLSRRPLTKHAFDHNWYEIYAIIDDMREEQIEQIKLHGGTVEEPKKLTRSGIGQILAHFNG